MDMLEQARKRLGSHAHSQLSGISNGISSAIHTGSLFPTLSLGKLLILNKAIYAILKIVVIHYKYQINS